MQPCPSMQVVGCAGRGINARTQHICGHVVHKLYKQKDAYILASRLVTWKPRTFISREVAASRLPVKAPGGEGSPELVPVLQVAAGLWL